MDSRAAPLEPRASTAAVTGAGELLQLLQDPYKSQLQTSSIWASIGTSFGFTILIAIGFSLLRPYNSVVYAPKLKHADDQHAPPPMGKGVFAWVMPVIGTKEQELVHLIGLDATIFLRFTRMCRNLCLVLTIIGCGILVPTYLVKGVYDADWKVSWLSKLTPANIAAEASWAQVFCAWFFDIAIVGILWWNYRAVLRLRRQYFDSAEYHNSLHARTLMINDIPKSARSDEGISRIIDEVVPESSFARTAIARNVKEIPALIKQHESAVRKLEKHLAKYLKNPDQLPAVRPTCKPSKKDPSYATYPKGQKLDAIEYFTGRIRDLEQEIKDVRLTIDKRNPMPYGFASYEDIAEAHTIAYQARNKHPQGTTIVLAPRPNDILWDNMPLSNKQRFWRRVINNFWILALTVVWIAPNAMISIFLVQISNLGLVWNDFQTSLAQNPTWWSIFQGVASPALTSIIFLLLPTVFRRLSIRAGDRTKTARDRHVASKLYMFFVFNNLLVFSIFSTAWTFAANVIKSTNSGDDAWTAIVNANFGANLHASLCDIAPFWITWLLQRNLGAAVDLAQLWTLVWSFCSRKFSSPTPRELIELTAPPAFDYSNYYNYFLFYITVALCYATILPLVLPAAAIYFCLDVYLKKYLLLYIFVTKNESGGMFWRTVFNRVIFASILANLVVFLSVFVRGDGTHTQAYAVIPLPFLMIAFKVYCARTFDRKIHYSAIQHVQRDIETDITKIANLKGDRLASRFGHPALYRPLITPMVHANAQNILASIYRGRLTDGAGSGAGDMMSVSGYSDTYALDPMKAGQPGRSAAVKSGKGAVPGFEIVPESHLDFAYFKNREEFGEDHGGGGQIYGKDDDAMSISSATTRGIPGRFGSPTNSRPSSPAGGQRSRLANDGTTYPSGYAPPSGYDIHGDMGMGAPLDHADSRDSHMGLMYGAAGMPVANPGPDYRPASRTHHQRSQSGSQSGSQELGGRAPGFLGGGPQGYGGLPQHEEPDHDPTSYDYFRGGSSRKNSAW